MSGLIVSKQGIQAVASEDAVSGLICLKVSLPLDRADQSANRYPLFSGNNPPNLLGKPEIHSLPLSNPTSPLLVTASRLLGLGSSYPPTQQTGGGRPSIDISKSTGQVYVVLDAKRPSGRRESIKNKDGRREWLILIHFQLPITTHGHANLVSLGLPKCLDNVIRFQILTPHATSSTDSGEVNVMTEPKVRPVASSIFKQNPRSRTGRSRQSQSRKMRVVGADEGWEDGEDMGPEGAYTDDEEDEQPGEEDEESDTEGSWLEGRFPSTDTLRLEWSFGTPPPTFSWLAVSPRWDKQSSSIHVRYQSLPVSSGTLPVEAIIPEGWGWSSLSVRGEGLTDWRSVDGDWWDETEQPRQLAGSLHPDDSAATEVEDSFSTAIQRLRPSTPNRAPLTPTSLPHRNTLDNYSSVNLLKQRIPSHLSKVEDFSFEMSQTSMETAKPFTPISKPSTPSPAFGQASVHSQASQLETSQSAITRYTFGRPAPARLFDLSFKLTSSFVLEGTLVPISRLTLVSPTLPLAIPFIRVDTTGVSQECEVTCVGSTRAEGLANTALPSIGSLHWTDDDELQPFEAKLPIIDGDVQVRLMRDSWGLVSMHIDFAWPKRASEIGFSIPSPDVRLDKATSAVEAVPTASHVTDDETTFRIGNEGVRRDGRVQITLDLRTGEVIPLPRLNGSGKMVFHFKGDHWDLERRNIKTNMIRLSPSSFAHELSSSIPPSFVFAPAKTTSLAPKPSRGLLSWSTLINLFLVWILVSLAIQVQRLRNEVAFVAEEAKDLRLYGLASTGSTTTPLPSIVPTATATPSIDFDTTTLWSDPRHTACADVNTDVSTSPIRTGDLKTSLGRVVFGRSAWDKWASHPTSIGKGIGIGIGWVWHGVVWLVNPI